MNQDVRTTWEALSLYFHLTNIMIELWTYVIKTEIESYFYLFIYYFQINIYSLKDNIIFQNVTVEIEMNSNRQQEEMITITT